ncbi:MAG: hypothetical protein Q8P67_16160 [archaeon]|nr:hypothetical protein [archaeon]
MGGWGLHTHFPEDRGGREASKKWVLDCASKRTKKRQEKLKEMKEKRETNEALFLPMIFIAPDFLENWLDFPLMIIKKYSRSQPEFKSKENSFLAFN